MSPGPTASASTVLPLSLPSQTDIPSAIIPGFANLRFFIFGQKWWLGHRLVPWKNLVRDGRVNGRLAFWLACLTAMAGCWLWSMSKARRREPPKHLAQRRCRNHDTLAGTVTSSEDEDPEPRNTLSKKAAVDARNMEYCPSYQPLSVSDDYVDPGLLKKHSSYVTYTTSVATYPSIRTFLCRHPHMEKFPSKPLPIPLLVFIHGLGGSLAQFHPLLTSLSNIGPCFGIDLPGCGLSSFSPSTWAAYSIDALAELLAVAIEKHQDQEAGQGVVLIAHSMGCSLAALLASQTSPIQSELRKHIVGLIAICPRASPPSPQDVTLFRRLLWIPNPIFNLWRLWDRRGGLQSTSVTRFVGEEADADTRQLQHRFNQQSRTPVWRRMAWGTLPDYESGRAVRGLPGRETWVGVLTSILLVAGEADAVTRPAEVDKIREYLDIWVESDGSAARAPSSLEAPQLHEGEPARPGAADEEATYGPSQFPVMSDAHHVKRVVKTTVLPAPASHALLYDRSTYRTLAGLIQDFLFEHVDHRVNLGWQLQHLNTSGKWDVKNLAKWKKVTATSEPIANTFIAMKMLREVDEEHNPVLFAQTWKGQIYAMIDISHANPVYDPAQLESGGIHYHKHPTVSKIPPTPDETRDFIALVDRLENEITDRLDKNGDDGKNLHPLVGVHCHYGFNRTGFLIVSYLIERKGFSVQDAIDEFERRRPPGIRHDHFIDTLFVRYCVGLQRAPTL